MLTLLSDQQHQSFDKNDPSNKKLYLDKPYKIIIADKAFDLGFYEEKLLKNLDPETYKKGPHDVTRFIKRKSSTRSGETVTDLYEIVQSIIDVEEKHEGYYAAATNPDDPAKEIIRISPQRYKIEDCFRVMKTNFAARPVFHQKRERIIAHFMICYTALLIYRLLEKKPDQQGTHFMVENIIETLRNMERVS